MKKAVTLLLLILPVCAVSGEAETTNTFIYAQNRLYKATLLTPDAYVSEQGGNDFPVTLTAHRVSSGEAIRLLCLVGCTKYRFEREGVVISHFGDEWPTKRQVFRVKPEFGDLLGGAVTDEALRKYLDSVGLRFSAEHRAHYEPAKGLLFVRLAESECQGLERYLRELGVLESVRFPNPKPLTASDVAWGKKLDTSIPALEFEQVPFARAVIKLGELIKQADPEGVGIPIALETSYWRYDARVIRPLGAGSESSDGNIFWNEFFAPDSEEEETPNKAIDSDEE